MARRLEADQRRKLRNRQTRKGVISQDPTVNLDPRRSFDEEIRARKIVVIEEITAAVTLNDSQHSDAAAERGERVSIVFNEPHVDIDHESIAKLQASILRPGKTRRRKRDPFS